ncbi:hypothetical protein KKZ38_12665 [Enterobacter hormaechei subsp. xiangfangensis]|uniref:hypothetical protein n=1 Tax=Enterobacter hormaechei TaxID=158836 RepID=UPI001BE0A713|nr:hypothetical protein [Enterobacter hormaechei]MBT2010636.1 hypothetical protein [Enterobacter hormaechei subsp. xiangfangensis]ELD3423021.1 hypothetical protein [Enterobacter hormaechei]MBT2019379.1 hypothetical protein [Enterobacter hormaechei subsp. xiangfangensis]MBT2042228.1 hypothetical protein [Enterobacter hormaechei subsp. xiangfangensis]MED5750214.1 hypothetical protein [Enterobacter hormaechei]
MGWSSLVRITIGIFLLAGLSSSAYAKNCKKGIPCGNSCIAVGKTCRIGSSSASTYKNYSYSYPSSSFHSSTTKSSSHSPSAKGGGKNTASTAKTYLCQYAIGAVQNGRIGALRVLGKAEVTLYVDSFKANRLDGTYLLTPKLKTKGILMMADDKSKVYAYDPSLKNFAISDRIARSTEQWDRCELVQNK